MDRSTSYVWALLLGPVAYFACLGFHEHHPLLDGVGYEPWQYTVAAMLFLGGCFLLGRVRWTRPVMIGILAGSTLAGSATLDWGTKSGATTSIFLGGMLPMLVIASALGAVAAVAGHRTLR